ncbi:hypothetical protein FACS1894105_05290 [Clostridia bacterium]|nr:hypothetical protein FACS1894105_05290 [Clostridia bacterium]GHV10810.1 hypothetical protein FACS1894219_00940 [Clostridia bacterium]
MKYLKEVIPITVSEKYIVRTIPGTTLPYTDANTQAFAYIRPLITAAGGLTLSQVCTITGLEGSTIQNWVKRGWIGGSLRSKKYDERQVATILIFSALRDSLKLDCIDKLLSYINCADGSVDEGDIFSLMCEAVKQIGLNIDEAENVIDNILSELSAAGGKRERMKKALMVMVYACVSSELSQTANFNLMRLI